jgi:hypothetical protein
MSSSLGRLRHARAVEEALHLLGRHSSRRQLRGQRSIEFLVGQVLEIPRPTHLGSLKDPAIHVVEFGDGSLLVVELEPDALATVRQLLDHNFLKRRALVARQLSGIALDTGEVEKVGVGQTGEFGNVALAGDGVGLNCLLMGASPARWRAFATIGAILGF